MRRVDFLATEKASSAEGLFQDKPINGYPGVIVSATPLRTLVLHEALSHAISSGLFSTDVGAQHVAEDLEQQLAEERNTLRSLLLEKSS